ncbi:MAG: glycosyltransferase family 2 protein [Clostridia bacterium]|nr:glycosyltransferase family 2 protein [Clostridia bacterium]
MSDITLTVFTPTYNRQYNLVKLFESLRVQTDKDFKWHIIDDGSKDQTKEFVKGFIAENAVNIEYTYQENSGKYVAHNNAVKMCSTELFACVDSDDTLVPTAVEKIKTLWKSVKNNDKLCGMVSPRNMPGCKGFVNAPESGTLMNLYNGGYFHGETLLVFRSDVIKNYLFPEIPGERFMTESIIYNQIDKDYVLYYDNSFLCQGEYLEGGLTKTANLLNFKNPISSLVAYNNTAAFQTNLLKSSKSYGCYKAWKKVMNVPDADCMWHVPFKVRFCGSLLTKHYLRLFKDQKKLFEDKHNG